MNPYTDEQKAFIIQHGAYLTTSELHTLLNERFVCNHSLGSVRTKTKQLGVKKHPETISKAHKRPLYKVGDSRIINGYEYLKVSDIGKGFYKQWDRKCRIVWKQHFGDIPDGYMVVCLNGDKLDCRIENLACVSKGTAARMGNGHGKAFWSEFPEVTKTALLMCELDASISREVVHNGKINPTR